MPYSAVRLWLVDTTVVELWSFPPASDLLCSPAEVVWPRDELRSGVVSSDSINKKSLIKEDQIWIRGTSFQVKVTRK